MWEALLQAICLLLIIEGVIPFLYPAKWRRLVAQLALISDHQLRVMGLFSMLLGLSILYLLT
ncbi:MAG: hypothetical protein ACJA0C_000938 [Candidatus Endobugula sp.]|jgi:uncharacterized protein YjeT (DUF2065 family)